MSVVTLSLTAKVGGLATGWGNAVLKVDRLTMMQVRQGGIFFAKQKATSER